MTSVRSDRGHWAVENQNHRVGDVQFSEDACLSRKAHAALNNALGNCIAMILSSGQDIADGQRHFSLHREQAFQAVVARRFGPASTERHRQTAAGRHGEDSVQGPPPRPRGPRHPVTAGFARVRSASSGGSIRPKNSRCGPIRLPLNCAVSSVGKSCQPGGFRLAAGGFGLQTSVLRLQVH